MDRHELTEEEARRIADDAATRAVVVVFEKLGFDVEDWREYQQDMAFVRQQRLGSERIAIWTRRTMVGAFLSGVLWILGQGITHALKQL